LGLLSTLCAALRLCKTRSRKDKAQEPTNSLVKAVGFLDEAGEKGLIRNLKQDRDKTIALLGALVFPLNRIDEFRQAFAPLFDRFKKEGGSQLKKLHIAEAFAPGNENLRPMATEVRGAVFDLIRSKQVPIIYVARRMKLLREAHVRLEALKAQALTTRRATHISMPNRLSLDRIEQDLMTGLALRLDAFAEDAKIDLIDLATDQIDIPISLALKESVDQTRSISLSQKIVKAYDLNKRKPVQGSITMSVKNPPFELDVRRVGSLKVVGKDDPLTFAIDVIVNALNDHLSALNANEPLNAPSSIAGWALEDRVRGVADGMAEDLY
jgi:hypothetical protein